MARPTRAQRKASGAKRQPVNKRAANAANQVRTKHAKPKPAPRPSLPVAWRIGYKTLGILWYYRIFFVSIALIYLLLDLLLVRSVSVFNVANLKDTLDESLRHGAGAALGGLSVFASLFTTAASGASTDATGAYHFFLILLMSLVVIWGLRQIFVSENVQAILKVKTAFYQSTAQLVPFMLLLFWLGVQFVPLFIVLQIYTLVLGGGVANSLLEQLFFLGVLFASIGITIVWFSRTIVALYIVTLPDMQPVEAYKKAKQLVRGRRLSIVRKLLFLPLVLFVGAGLIMIPCILIWAPLAQWLFFVMTGVGFIFAHAYLYTLYRELLV